MINYVSAKIAVTVILFLGVILLTVLYSSKVATGLKSLAHDVLKR